MKSIGVTLQCSYLPKNAKKNIVQHPAKPSNILGETNKISHNNCENAFFYSFFLKKTIYSIRPLTAKSSYVHWQSIILASGRSF